MADRSELLISSQMQSFASPKSGLHVPECVQALSMDGADVMGAISSHKDLIVWQKSISLASKVYSATNSLPDHERYGLSSQMRRSALSIASNIAEGAGRAGRGEYIQFLSIARGSLAELETQICISGNLRLIDEKLRLEEEAAEVGRLLTALIRKLRERRELT
jgi:four helix bundle protein